MSVLGIDPGKDGAIACLDEHTGLIEDIFYMPLTKVGRRSNGNDKLQVDPQFLADVLGAWLDDSPLVAIMESVHASPQMGAVSSFSFGEGVGLVTGVLTTLGIELHKVTPKTWKGYYGLSGGRDQKGEALELARATWPTSELFKRKKDSDRAEAALMARYYLVEVR